MPEVMRQYGAAIVVAVGVSLIITMLFVAWPGGSGTVLDDVGSRAGAPLRERTVTGTGTAGFKEHSARSLPTARVNGPVRQGEEALLLAGFTVTDSDGAAWDQSLGAFVGPDGSRSRGTVRVTSITSTDGTEHMGSPVLDSATERVLFSPSTGMATFLAPGVYRVGLSVLDHDNVPATYTIPLVVDFVLEDEGAADAAPEEGAL